MDKYIAIPSDRLYEIVLKYIDHKQAKAILGGFCFLFKQIKSRIRSVKELTNP